MAMESVVSRLQRFIRYMGVAFFSLVLGVVATAMLLDDPTTRQSEVTERPAINISIDEMAKLVNEERAKVGVAPLELREELNESAAIKAVDMSTNKYFDHANPVTGKQGYSYIETTMPGACRRVSENLHESYGMDEYASADAIKGWMGSKSHREAILDPRYAYVGYAFVESSQVKASSDGVYVVQHFCQPV